MARAALGWTVKDLGRRAHVSASSVVRFENDRHEANEATVLAMQRAFEDAGVRFTDDGGIVPPKKGVAE